MKLEQTILDKPEACGKKWVERATSPFGEATCLRPRGGLVARRNRQVACSTPIPENFPIANAVGFDTINGSNKQHNK
jgi:hypothetical protein